MTFNFGSYLVWPRVGFHLVNFRSLFMNFGFLLNFLCWLLVLLSGWFRHRHSLGGARVGGLSRRAGACAMKLC